MGTLLEIGLSNAIMAVVLAVPAAAVGLIWRRPALAHCLWLLVLFKLVTPPLWPVHIPWPDSRAEIDDQQAARVVANDEEDASDLGQAAAAEPAPTGPGTPE